MSIEKISSRKPKEKHKFEKERIKIKELKEKATNLKNQKGEKKEKIEKLKEKINNKKFKIAIGELKGIYQRSFIEKQNKNVEARGPENEKEIIKNLKKELVNLPVDEDYHQEHLKILEIIADFKNECPEDYEEVFGKNEEIPATIMTSLGARYDSLTEKHRDELSEVMNKIVRGKEKEGKVSKEDIGGIEDLVEKMKKGGKEPKLGKKIKDRLTKRKNLEKARESQSLESEFKKIGKIIDQKQNELLDKVEDKNLVMKKILNRKIMSLEDTLKEAGEYYDESNLEKLKEIRKSLDKDGDDTSGFRRVSKKIKDFFSGLEN